MAGTFLPGDRLLFRQLPFEQIQRGDVVFIASAENEIVHRVIGITAVGLVTCGDANSCPDPNMVTPQTLIGLVTHYERHNAIHNVPGGNAGLLWLAWLRGQRKLERLIRMLGGWFYRRLRVSHVIELIWQPEICQLSFQTPEGRLVKYTYKGKTVATWWPEQRRFECRKPYDLIIYPPEAPKSK